MTEVSLLDHVNQRFADQEKAVNAALAAAEKAVDKAEQAQALRNEAQNEFRKSLGDLSALMWTFREGTAALEALKGELTGQIEAMEKRLSAVERAGATLQGRAIAFAGFGALIGGSAVAFIIKSL